MPYAQLLATLAQCQRLIPHARRPWFLLKASTCTHLAQTTTMESSHWIVRSSLNELSSIFCQSFSHCVTFFPPMQAGLARQVHVVLAWTEGTARAPPQLIFFSKPQDTCASVSGRFSPSPPHHPAKIRCCLQGLDGAVLSEGRVSNFQRSSSSGIAMSSGAISCALLVK